tara:strand:- start:6281 stop:6454 length:174 start_codon:yes stop_codon:yes gene_type:complete
MCFCNYRPKIKTKQKKMSKKLRKLLFDLKDENWLPSMPDETREIFIQLILNKNKEDG